MNHFGCSGIKFIEMVSLILAHAPSRIAFNALQARMQITDLIWKMINDLIWTVIEINSQAFDRQTYLRIRLILKTIYKLHINVTLFDTITYDSRLMYDQFVTCKRIWFTQTTIKSMVSNSFSIVM